MKNVTITLDEQLAQWARVEAAKAGKSLSRWIAEKLAAARNDGSPAAKPPQDWLDAPLWHSIAEPIPTRSELYENSYDRPGFRGYERTDLQPRSGSSGEGSPIGGLAEETSAEWTGGKPPGPE